MTFILMTSNCLCIKAREREKTHNLKMLRTVDGRKMDRKFPIAYCEYRVPITVSSKPGQQQQRDSYNDETTTTNDYQMANECFISIRNVIIRTFLVCLVLKRLLMQSIGCFESRRCVLYICYGRVIFE